MVWIRIFYRVRVNLEQRTPIQTSWIHCSATTATTRRAWTPWPCESSPLCPDVPATRLRRIVLSCRHKFSEPFASFRTSSKKMIRRRNAPLSISEIYQPLKAVPVEARSRMCSEAALRRGTKSARRLRKPLTNSKCNQTWLLARRHKQWSWCPRDTQWSSELHRSQRWTTVRSDSRNTTNKWTSPASLTHR